MPFTSAQERPTAPGTEDVAEESLGTSSLKKLAASPESEAPVNRPLAVPANDECAGALTIPAAGPFPHLTAAVDLLDATIATDPAPTCAFNNVFSRGVWWSFTPSTTGNYRFSTCGTTSPQQTHPDTVMAIFTSGGGCGGPFTQAFCNDDDASCAASTLQSTLTAPLTAGTTYYVLVYSWNTTAPNPAASTVQIQVQQVIINTPANDTCAGAQALSLNYALGTNLAANNDYTLSGTACFTGLGQVTSTAPGRDTVYSFTAPEAGSYSFKATIFDAAGGGNLVLYTSPTCPTAGAIPCTAPVSAANRQTGTLNQTASESVRCVPLAQDETVYVFVDEHVAGAAGGGHLIEATKCGAESEPNGTPAEAQTLPVDSCPLIDGSISAGDVDFYSLGAPPAGTRVFAVADAVMSNNTDFDMRVTTTTDTLEYDDIDNSTSFGGNSANIAGRALTGVDSFIRVNHFSATTNAEPYRLYAVSYPPGADPYGSSSSPEQRNAQNGSLGGSEAAANNYFHGATQAANDLDAYLFCANEGDIVTMQIDADPGRDLTPFNPAIFLFNELGAQLLGLSDAGSTSNNTSGAGSLTADFPNSPGEVAIWRARYTGAYYAGVNSQPIGGVTVLGDYLLSIANNCSTGVVNNVATITTDLTASAATVANGQEYSYFINLTNSGPKTASALQFTFPLPPGVEMVDLLGDGTDAATCTQVPAPGANGTIVCRVECLRSGGDFEFEVVVTAPYCSGDVALDATVTVTSVTTLDGGSTLVDSVSINVDDDGTCDDGLFCTLGDACVGGSCVGATPNTCDDSDPCTIDECGEETGCFNSFDEGAICDDGDPCTQIDICLSDPGGCVGFEPVGQPNEVNNVQFDGDKETYAWEPDGAAFTYDALRGDLSALPVGPGGGDEVCFDGIGTNITSDPTVPGIGAGFWYLVRGENTCGPAGTWGNDSGGNPRTSTTCP